jgi:hypothetical protein
MTTLQWRASNPEPSDYEPNALTTAPPQLDASTQFLVPVEHVFKGKSYVFFSVSFYRIHIYPDHLKENYLGILKKATLKFLSFRPMLNSVIFALKIRQFDSFNYKNSYLYRTPASFQKSFILKWKEIYYSVML